MKEMTKRQKQVLSFIRSEIRSRERPPTLHEIKDHFGWVSTNAARSYLLVLQDKGEITFDKHHARGIRLKSAPRGRELMELPVVGSVAAGTPIEAIENIDEHIGIDPDMFPGDENFGLTVKGDSMEGIGIRDGDIVIVKKQVTAENGDIVVAMIDGEATVKKLVRKGKRVFLHPENERYEDIELSAEQDTSICGVVIGVIRRL